MVEDRGGVGKKLKEYETAKDEVMILAERVGEAQRGAVMEMKELHESRGKKGATLKGRRRGGGNIGGAKRSRDEMDREEG